MSVAAAGSVSQPKGVSWLWRRQLDTYPDTAARVGYLALTVIATVMLYYELYVGGSVSTLILAHYHMSFLFFVDTLAFGNLIGAFGSLFAGLTDRVGRTNLVVGGLIPNAPNKWAFVIEGWAVAVIEGICLVATPALIRDFSPQVGRGTAMGFWTSGPVLGSLVVALVATHTIGSSPSPSFWTHEYHICGIAGLVVAALALVGLRELSPALRDQLMVTMRDRALIEARAKGLDIESLLTHPWRQLMKLDVVGSAIGISIFLLIYYAAVGFALIYLTTVFGFSVKDANGLGNWNWGFNVLAVIAFGWISDRFRVRKPFMVLGGAAAAVLMVVFLTQFHHGLSESYYTLAVIVAFLSFCLGVAYVPWMASFTETVEEHNPALTATGLAIWGWIIRVVVFAWFLIIPAIVNTVTPLVQYGPTVSAAAAGSPRYHIPPQYQALAWASTPTGQETVAAYQKYASEFTFAQTHTAVVAEATALGPELQAITSHLALFTQLHANPTNTALSAQAEQAVGPAVFAKIVANQATITNLLSNYGTQLAALRAVPASAKALVEANAANLKALNTVPSSVRSYVQAHGAAVARDAAKTPAQWQHLWWVCFGAMIFFLLTIPLMRGRWSPKKARQDEAEHEAMVQAELAKLAAGGASA
jgi:MFS family permease